MNNETSSEDLLQSIKRLWNESFRGLLSTHSIKFPGYPFGSLLPTCRDQKGNMLLLISHLAQHTRNLESDPHCSMTLSECGNGDVQQLARLTCLTKAEPLNSTAASERYFRYYPTARRYHKELNFNFYKLSVEQYYFIGGFGSARWFDSSRIEPSCAYSTSDEAEALYQLNAHNHQLLIQYLGKRGFPSNPAGVEAVGADPMGLDIRDGDNLRRVHAQQACESVDDFLQMIETG
ncbi:MAG: CREG family protein [Candidatus Thiodiazotropha weberae]|nr:CREG family protein [Candidatus Thiodiazotropha weberae]